MNIIEKLKKFFIEEIEIKDKSTNDFILKIPDKPELNEIQKINEINIYSYSKINTFKECPYKYKLKYIDHENPEIIDTIETFLGRIVHQCLQELYQRINSKQKYSKEELINLYIELWDKGYSEGIRIVKKYQGLDKDYYKQMGKQYLSDYYETYKPFKELNIIALETEDKIILPDGNHWHVRIDKLGHDNKGTYYICDYKTTKWMKSQEEADEDIQLAMYSIWVKNNFKSVKKIKLLWHMLAFNRIIVSERTDEELRKLEEEIITTIKNIENTINFPTKESALCPYCEFTSKCPIFVDRWNNKYN